VRTLAAAALVLCAALATPADAVEPLPAKLRGITVNEHLGDKLDLTARFTDHRGRKVALKSFFDGKRPVLLTLNYYRCKTLCSIQLNALTRALKGLDWTAGEKFRVVTISIDQRETPELARKKRASYLGELGRGQDVDWTFMVGDKEMIQRVAKGVGVVFRYDPEQDQFAHPAVAVFLSPTGKISRYVYGLELKARDVKFALIDASEGKVGSTVERIILSCFHYDAESGRYGPWAFGIMRLAGVATVLVLGVFLGVFWLRERRRRRADRAGQTQEAT